MKRTMVFLLILLPLMTISAGELAVLENLGFSPNGRYFMFGQHVLIPDAGQAYAETAVVDVANNEFVPGGWKKSIWNIRMLPNQNSRGALYEILDESVDLKKRYNLSHLEQGHLLYTQNNGDDAMVDSDEGDLVPVLSFRDFERGREYSLALNQKSKTEDSVVSSSFSIDLRVTDSNGAESTYVVGNPSLHRPDVSSYRIVRVWLGPNGRSLVIAVAKVAPDLSVRYMVETLVLNG